MEKLVQLLKIISSNQPKAIIAKAILLHQLKIPICLISLILNLPPQTIKNHLRTWKRTGKIHFPKRRGRRKKIGEREKQKILEVFLTHPHSLGLAISHWTLRSLSHILKVRFGLEVSHETVRKVLRERGIRFRRPRKYIRSKDPLYAHKARMLRELEGKVPKDIAVFWVDESVKVAKGWVWAGWGFGGIRYEEREGERRGGVVSFYLAKGRDGELLGVARDGWCDGRKFLELVGFVCAYAKSRGYRGVVFIMDNATYHRGAEGGMRRVGEQFGLDVMWFYLPKYSPWLNRVEGEWSVFRRFYLPFVERGDKEGLKDRFVRFVMDRTSKSTKIF